MDRCILCKTECNDDFDWSLGEKLLCHECMSKVATRIQEEAEFFEVEHLEEFKKIMDRVVFQTHLG